MRLYGRQQGNMHIAENVMFHEKTKHIKVDYHIIRKKLEANIILAKYVASGHQLADSIIKPLGRTRVDFICDMTKYVESGYQLADLLTKSLSRIKVEFICDKLGMYDIYAPG